MTFWGTLRFLEDRRSGAGRCGDLRGRWAPRAWGTALGLWLAGQSSRLLRCLRATSSSPPHSSSALPLPLLSYLLRDPRRGTRRLSEALNGHLVHVLPAGDAAAVRHFRGIRGIRLHVGQPILAYALVDEARPGASVSSAPAERLGRAHVLSPRYSVRAKDDAH